jgi:hypothetical protein
VSGFGSQGGQQGSPSVKALIARGGGVSIGLGDLAREMHALTETGDSAATEEAMEELATRLLDRMPELDRGDAPDG